MPVETKLSFNPGDVIKCHNISILSDQIPESTESFRVSLYRQSGLNYRIRVLQQSAGIVIDSDVSTIER